MEYAVDGMLMMYAAFFILSLQCNSVNKTTGNQQWALMGLNEVYGSMK